ncbi:MAG: DUF2878 domain-containing protein [Halioglobus sp.]|nr:DUF2878 domain-containing protein [Halioglobus sp.]
MLYTLLNGLMFNVTWLIIVTTESALIAPVAALLHVLIHFAVMGKGYIELRVILQVALFGAFVDQILFYLQVFVVSGQPALPPLWLTCLWPVLATTLMHAFSGLQNRYLLAALLGGVGGAASFVAGTRLTSVEFDSPFWGPVIIAVLWAVVFPLLLQLPRLNGYGKR